MAAAQNDKWKEKYLGSLDQLEQKEKLWAEAEDLLRRSLSRLIYTGYGTDKVLDRKLDRVRKAIRDRRDPATLERLVREASDTAVERQENAKETGAETGRALAQLLTGLTLSGAWKKKAQELAQQLKLAGSKARVDPLIEDVSALLSTVVSATETVPADKKAAQDTAKRGGLLGRFMGARQQASAPDDSADMPDSFAGTANILEQLLDRVHAGDPWSERLNDVKRQAAACRDEAEALEVLERVAGTLSEMLQSAEAAGSGGHDGMQSLPSAGEALLTLMENLDIPVQLQDRLGAIKNDLLQAATSEQVQSGIQSIADMMSTIRHEILNEKQELERFLEGVTSRIQTLSEHVADLGGNRASSTLSRDAFQRSFQSQMDGIRTNMKAEEDIQRLKQAIEQSLDTIEESMHEYVEREESMVREAQERIKDLSSRLHDMQHEAFLLQKKMQEQRDISMKDPLTGVYNRLAYEERIQDEYHRWRRYGAPLSLLVLDIDHFKRVNDTYGHLAGDKALKALALRLVQNTREVDMVARYGGEEFVVIMPNTAADQAHLVAEKLRSAVAEVGFHYRKQPVHITISCGVASFRAEDTADDVFRRADHALYGAKSAGRNRTHREDEPIVSEQSERPQRVADLR